VIAQSLGVAVGRGGTGGLQSAPEQRVALGAWHDAQPQRDVFKI
jgi:hypothetical protein